MEYNEKLRMLRKQQGMTQEQLAEKLYVSRAAVAKWESGKGYPNIESLKAIAKLFDISLDDFLSSEELILMAESEKLQAQEQNAGFSLGLIDVMMAVMFFLPLFGQADVDMIRMVSLYSYRESAVIKIFSLLLIGIMVAAGGWEVAASLRKFEDPKRYSYIMSLSVSSIAVIGFTATRQPYVVTYVFLFFVLKLIFLFKSRR